MSNYPLSFTAGALLEEESRQVAASLLRTGDVALAKSDIRASGALHSRTETAGKRVLSELIFRLSPLSDFELQLISQGDAVAARQFLWINCCLRYPLIREFAEGPLAGAFSASDTRVEPNQIEAFIWDRSQQQPELAKTTPSTKAKLRQVLGLMMLQAGLVNANRELVHGLLSPDLANIFDSYPEALNWTAGLRRI